MKQSITDTMIRYILMVLLIPLVNLIYSVFLPLTLHPVYWIISVFYPATLIGNSILVGLAEIEIIRACVGVSAIFLLIILNLATPLIKPVKRFKLLLITVLLFLIFNWIRILILSALFLEEFILFNQIHTITWYAISTIAVAIIWILSVNYFKIKKAPFISDFYFLKEQT